MSSAQKGTRESGKTPAKVTQRMKTRKGEAADESLVNNETAGSAAGLDSDYAAYSKKHSRVNTTQFNQGTINKIMETNAKKGGAPDTINSSVYKNNHKS